MGDKREREAERLSELNGALTEVSAALLAATRRLPDGERAVRLAPIVATDAAMLRALDAEPAPDVAFDGMRRRLLAAFRAQAPRARLPWHGGPMTVEWAVRNRLAASWRVLDEVAESSGASRPDPRQAIVELALELVQHNFLRAGLGAPDMAVAVHLDVPGQAPWVFTSRQPAGWAPSAEVVTGPAHDFCRLACGRSTREQTTLAAAGGLADLWLDVVDALAYSEPPI
jgi:hypothetical protein